MANPTTNIPAVPIKTAMFDAKGNLTRTWILFFESLAGAKPPSASVGGGGGGGSSWVQESPTGVRDGSNTVFTLTWAPQISPWSNLPIVILGLNGVELTPFDYSSQGYLILGGDYSLDGNTITMAKAPVYTDYLIATYFPQGTAPAGGSSGGSAVPTAAALFVKSAASLATSGHAALSLWDVNQYGNTALIPPGINVGYLDCQQVFNRGSGYSSLTESFQLISSPPPTFQSNNALKVGPYPTPAYLYDTVADLLRSLILTFWVYDASGPDPSSTFSIYDCYLQVLAGGATATYRPRAYRWISGNPTSVSSVANPQYAIDNDPTTAAVITCATPGGADFLQPGFLQLYNFG